MTRMTANERSLSRYARSEVSYIRLDVSLSALTADVADHDPFLLASPRLL